MSPTSGSRSGGSIASQANGFNRTTVGVVHGKCVGMGVVKDSCQTVLAINPSANICSLVSSMVAIGWDSVDTISAVGESFQNKDIRYCLVYQSGITMLINKGHKVVALGWMAVAAVGWAIGRFSSGLRIAANGSNWFAVRVVDSIMVGVFVVDNSIISVINIYPSISSLVRLRFVSCVNTVNASDTSHEHAVISVCLIIQDSVARFVSHGVHVMGSVC